MRSWGLKRTPELGPWKLRSPREQVSECIPHPWHVHACMFPPKLSPFWPERAAGWAWHPAWNGSSCHGRAGHWCGPIHGIAQHIQRSELQVSYMKFTWVVLGHNWSGWSLPYRWNSITSLYHAHCIWFHSALRLCFPTVTANQSPVAVLPRFVEVLGQKLDKVRAEQDGFNLSCVGMLHGSLTNPC